jgi:hypothetical protein
MNLFAVSDPEKRHEVSAPPDWVDGDREARAVGEHMPMEGWASLPDGNTAEFNSRLK